MDARGKTGHPAGQATGESRPAQEAADSTGGGGPAAAEPTAGGDPPATAPGHAPSAAGRPAGRTLLRTRLRQLRNMRVLLGITGVRWWHVALPVFFSMVAATLTSAGLGLLVPLANGLAKNDYASALGIPVLGDVVRAFADVTAPRQILLVLVVAVCVVNVGNFFLKYLFGLYSRHWNGIFALTISDRVFGRLLSLSRRYYDETSQGSVTQVMGFSESVLKALNSVRDVIASLFQLAARLTVMVLISWQLTVAALLLFPVLHFGVSWMRGRIRALSRRRTEVTLDLSRDVFNMLSSIDLIKAYGHEGPVRERLRTKRDQTRVLQYRAMALSSLVKPIQDTIILVALLAMVVVAVFTISPDAQDRIAEYVVLFYVAQSALPHFTKITQLRLEIELVVPELQKIWDVLQLTDHYLIPSGSREFPGLRETIELRELTFSYPKGPPVLRGVTLRIPRGQAVALVGATGSGKSTLVQLLLRFYDCPPGQILVDGVDLRDFQLDSLRRHVDYVSQDVLIFNDTVRANLTFGLQNTVSDEELWQALEQAQVAEVLRDQPGGLATVVGDRGVRLSGGERQRLAIARALLRRAEILILDEATSALDAETERHIQEAFADPERRRTTIVIAHRLSTVAAADLVAVLQEGRIVEQGPFAELRDGDGPFSQMWRAYHRAGSSTSAT